MIRKAYQDESLPMELLLLADPSEKQIHSYVSSGHCYLAEYEGVCRGVYVLQEKTPQTIELMNVAVAESWQGKGLGKQLILHASAYFDGWTMTDQDDFYLFSFHGGQLA